MSIVCNYLEFGRRVFKLCCSKCDECDDLCSSHAFIDALDYLMDRDLVKSADVLVVFGYVHYFHDVTGIDFELMLRWYRDSHDYAISDDDLSFISYIMWRTVRSTIDLPTSFNPPNYIACFELNCLAYDAFAPRIVADWSNYDKIHN